MGQIKVLMIVDHLGTNGAVTHVLSIAKALKKEGIYTTIAANSGAMEQRFADEKLPYYIVDFPTVFTNDIHLFSSAAEDLYRIIENEQINIIHGHQVYSSYFSCAIAKSRNIPFIYTIHGLYNRKEELINVFMQADKLIAVSPLVYEKMQQYVPKQPVLIPNGIDMDEFSPHPSQELRIKMNIPENEYIILYASRLEWKKADICMMVLNAFQFMNNPAVHLIIAGEGHRTKQILNMTAHLNRKQGRKCIHFVGNQPYLNQYVSIADCIIGTGRTALEAIASEKCVIAAGSEGYLGIVTKDNWKIARYGQFADHSAPSSINQSVLIRDIELSIHKHKKGIHSSHLRTLLSTDFNLDESAAKIREIYDQVLIDNF
ncbi:glycosyltransferase [Cytobacillus purgationiresistens]|uniref:Glycosyltransferase involved in cell wall biosynthesis n=1 Tax=Cytobacillus purgationiresistens TaxID=863449 RepID=A0ABU0AEP1_9BACI|nr:glycosyltransferase [Cytobacillus purgationiresistens]MDQ0269716.1 glycosyltransferase involved in cell wall biosynthesis [Cytobacillus purgationiresistens]